MRFELTRNFDLSIFSKQVFLSVNFALFGTVVHRSLQSFSKTFIGVEKIFYSLFNICFRLCFIGTDVTHMKFSLTFMVMFNMGIKSYL